MLRLFLLPSLVPYCHHAALAVTFRNQSSFCLNLRSLRVEPERKAWTQIIYLGSREIQTETPGTEWELVLSALEGAARVPLLAVYPGRLIPTSSHWLALSLTSTRVEAEGFCSSRGSFGRKLQGRGSAVYMSSQGNVPWNFSSYKCWITKPLPSPPCGPHDVCHMRRHLGAF